MQKIRKKPCLVFFLILFAATAKAGYWWDESFEKRVMISVSEDSGLKRVLEPVEVVVFFEKNEAKNNTIRVTSSEGGVETEIPSQIYNASFEKEYYSKATVAFLANVSPNSSATYYAYYSTEEKSPANYSFPVEVVKQKNESTNETDVVVKIDGRKVARFAGDRNYEIHELYSLNSTQNILVPDENIGHDGMQWWMDDPNQEYPDTLSYFNATPGKHLFGKIDAKVSSYGESVVTKAKMRFYKQNDSWVFDWVQDVEALQEAGRDASWELCIKGDGDLWFNWENGEEKNVTGEWSPRYVPEGTKWVAYYSSTVGYFGMASEKGLEEENLLTGGEWNCDLMSLWAGRMKIAGKNISQHWGFLFQPKNYQEVETFSEKFSHPLKAKVERKQKKQDLSAPQITNIVRKPQDPVEGETVWVFWETTQDANSTIYYRPAGGEFSRAYEESFGKQHGIPIGSFAEGETVQYYVESCNSIVCEADTNNGNYYGFVVLQSTGETRPGSLKISSLDHETEIMVGETSIVKVSVENTGEYPLDQVEVYAYGETFESSTGMIRGLLPGEQRATQIAITPAIGEEGDYVVNIVATSDSGMAIKKTIISITQENLVGGVAFKMKSLSENPFFETMQLAASVLALFLLLAALLIHVTIKRPLLLLFAFAFSIYTVSNYWAHPVYENITGGNTKLGLVVQSAAAIIMCVSIFYFEKQRRE